MTNLFYRTFQEANNFLQSCSCQFESCHRSKYAQPVDEYFSIGSCEHVFCGACAKIIKETRQCLICGNGTFPKDIRSHQQANELISLVKQLSGILSEDIEGEIIQNSQSLPAIEAPRKSTVPEITTSLSNGHPKKFVPNTNRKRSPSSYPGITFSWFSGSQPKKTAVRKARSGQFARSKGGKMCENQRASSLATGAVNRVSMKRSLSVPKSRDDEEPKKRNSASMAKRHRESMRKNEKGETPLHLACKEGNLGAVTAILKHSEINPNVKDNYGWSPLHEAASRGFTGIASCLIDHGAYIDITAGSECCTPLHDAVASGRRETVEVLLRKGADRSARDIFGKKPDDLAEAQQMKEILLVTECKQKQDLKDVKFDSVTESSQKVFWCSERNSKDPTLAAFKKNFNLSLGTEITENSTHLIVEADADNFAKRVYHVLQGIVRGMWIIGIDFVKESLARGGLAEEKEFEIKGVCVAAQNLIEGGPTRSRLNKLFTKPGLFYGCHFYICSKNFREPLPTKQQIIRLIELGGGKILKRFPTEEILRDDLSTVPYHAAEGSEVSKYSLFLLYVPGDVIFERPTEADKKRTVRVSATWVLDCISHFQLLSPY